MPAPLSTRTPRRLATRLLLALAALLAALGLAEVAARAALGQAFVPGELRSMSWKDCGQLDAQRGWRNRAGARAHIRRGQIDYRVHIGAHGWRDPERALPKPEGVRRVLLLGDSVSWGWGVDRGQRFSDLLEARLGPGVEVLNLAVPGYGTDQHLWTLLEDGLAFEPDAVLLCFVYNDFLEAASASMYDMHKPRFVRAGEEWRVEGRPVEPPPRSLKREAQRLSRRLVARSALLTWLSPGRGTGADLELMSFGTPQEAYLREFRAQCDDLVEQGTRTRMLLGRIVEECARVQLPLLVFNVPHKHDEYLYEPRIAQPAIEDAAAFSTYLSTRLAEAGDTLGFETVCVDAALLEAVGAGRLHCGDGHLNVAGNVCVADVLEPHVRALLGP